MEKNPFLYFFAAAILLAGSTLLRGQDTVFRNDSATGNLVELYTSEGCSSCPPAEAWLNRLQTSPALWRDVFPLAFHVDYWDGLGWPDRFASAAFTQRQRDYAARLRQDYVYTPEFVVNGQEWRHGSGSDQLPQVSTAKVGELTLVAHEDGKFSARYIAGAADIPAPVINIALLGFNVVVDVKRGENSGRKLEHDFVVLGFSSLSSTAREKKYEAEFEPIQTSTNDSVSAVVAWVSDAHGAVLQVTGGWLKKNLRGER